MIMYIETLPNGSRLYVVRSKRTMRVLCAFTIANDGRRRDTISH
jgi:hypothetical protein